MSSARLHSYPNSSINSRSIVPKVPVNVALAVQADLLAVINGDYSTSVWDLRTRIPSLDSDESRHSPQSKRTNTSPVMHPTCIWTSMGDPSLSMMHGDYLRQIVILGNHFGSESETTRSRWSLAVLGSNPITGYDQLQLFHSHSVGAAQSSVKCRPWSAIPTTSRNGRLLSAQAGLYLQSGDGEIHEGDSNAVSFSV
jgi:hypothetical protein